MVVSMVLFSFWLFVVVVLLGLQDISLGFEVILGSMGYPSFLLSNVLKVDSFTLFSMFMLFVCSSMAFIYCYHYFGFSDMSGLLFPLMVWFVGVMLCLVISGSMMLSLIFWEYLGFVSFLLMLFYNNASSVRASVITLVSSRFGDVGLFVMVCLLSGFWGLTSGGSSFFVLVFGSLSMMLIVLTKSACYPFVSWLLEAMRAPTPVSSLVHSSTLVAAGVWFLMRYGDMLMVGGSCFKYYVVSCVLTILLTAFCAMTFLDLKKMVALSTCNNISWCLLFYMLGDVDICVCQLVTHGVCKCFLFMMVGDLMSSSGSSQSSIGVYSLSYSGGMSLGLVGCLVFGLCGFPFLGMFFSKHLFYGSLAGGSVSVILLVLVLVGFCLSYSYSSRLMWLLYGIEVGVSFKYVSFFKLISFLLVVGNFMKYLVIGSLSENSSVNLLSSLAFLLVQVMGMFMGAWVGYKGSLGISGDMWVPLLFGCDWLVSEVYKIFKCMVGLCGLSLWRWEVWCGQWFLESREVKGFSVIFSFSMVMFAMLLWFFVYLYIS